MKTLKIEIIKTTPLYDSDTIIFKIGKEKVGHGFKAKDDGKMYIKRCPMCRKENYAPAVYSGQCVFCKYDPNIKI